ncbi:FAD-dependent monooxygenase [Streptosporangium sp. NPDC002721]|uniref:FAD-dependent monooxygenase n=1 Tax=Streptosporangium sp. NPDC002721 TaxID=3366188 RepID=UPI0036D0D0FF
MSVDVVIAGGGPNGLMLACELSLAGVRPVLLERLPEPGDEPRANGLVGEVVRVLDGRGLYRRFTGASEPPKPVPFFMFGGMLLDLSALDPGPLHTLPIPQRRLERLLQERALELGVEIRRGHELVDMSQDEDGVTVAVHAPGAPDGDYELRTRYLVGCDGARSLVRKRAGIGFPGVTDEDVVSRSAHAALPASLFDPATGELPLAGERWRPFMIHRTAHGVFSLASFEPGVHLLSTMEWGQREQVDERVPMTLEELRDSVRRVLGADLPLSPPEGPGPHVLRRVTGGNTRLADRYRAGRVLVAGDAAHVHSAAGGPGLNLGLQDVVNLGWKLAAEVHGWAPPGLLDTYHGERYPVGERVVMHTQAQSALLAPGGEVTALRTLFAELLEHDENRRRVAELMAGSDIRYDMTGPGTPSGADRPDPADDAGPRRAVAACGRSPATSKWDLIASRPCEKPVRRSWRSWSWRAAHKRPPRPGSPPGPGSPPPRSRSRPASPPPESPTGAGSPWPPACWTRWPTSPVTAPPPRTSSTGSPRGGASSA